MKGTRHAELTFIEQKWPSARGAIRVSRTDGDVHLRLPRAATSRDNGGVAVERGVDIATHLNVTPVNRDGM